MDSKTDNELVALARNKDSDAIAELCRRYQPMISNVKKQYYVRHYDFNDWDQDAMFVCFESACLFDETRNVKFGGFFQMRLLNHARSLLRYELAKKRAPYASAKSYEKEVEAGTLKSDEGRVYVNGQPITHQVLRKFIGHLSLTELISLRAHLGDLTDDEACQLANIGAKQLVSAKERCKAKLRNILLKN